MRIIDRFWKYRSVRIIVRRLIDGCDISIYILIVNLSPWHSVL